MADAPRLLVTRPAEAAAQFAAEAAQAGFEPVLEPMLTIEALPETPGAFDGAQAILLTSPTGARTLGAWTLGDRPTVDRDTPVLAVGAATAAAARAAGFAHVESADGDAAALAALAAARLDPTAGPVVHAAGERRAGDVVGALRAAGFNARVTVLYRAVEAGAISPETLSLLRAGAIAHAAFFSPQTARTFARLALEAGLTGALRGVHAAALSQNVGAALTDIVWRRLAVADAPTASALLAVLIASKRDAALWDGTGSAG